MARACFRPYTDAMDRRSSDAFAAARTRLLAEVEEDFRSTAKWTGRSHLSPRVLNALSRVPRHEFVPSELADSAYANRPLGIGHGQTISQPFIVALMTELLDLDDEASVLEIGTGSGYQAAVLAEIARDVYTVEFVAALASKAEAVLSRLGYKNIHFRVGDGRDGWPAAAPFPAIIVTAAAETIPDALIAQLAPGGRMIIPVGKVNGPQNLVLVRRDDSGRVSRETVLAVAFVPLVGGS